MNTLFTYDPATWNSIVWCFSFGWAVESFVMDLQIDLSEQAVKSSIDFP
jgi:hypothetical protein